IADLERLRTHRRTTATARDLLTRLERELADPAIGIAEMDDSTFAEYVTGQPLYRVWVELRWEHTLAVLTEWIAQAAALGPDSAPIVDDALRQAFAEPLLLDSD